MSLAIGVPPTRPEDVLSYIVSLLATTLLLPGQPCQRFQLSRILRESHAFHLQLMLLCIAAFLFMQSGSLSFAVVARA